MFEADWIIGFAGPAPDPATIRRPGLLKHGLRSKPIRGQRSLPPELRSMAGSYPKDGFRLDSSKPGHVIPTQLGRPGTVTWAAAVQTIDDPAVAIPLRLPSGLDTARLIRAFEVAADELLIMSIDLERHEQGRGRPTVASIGAVTVICDGRAGAEARLRELLEQTYLAVDPPLRDCALRADGREEPVVLVVAADRVAYFDVKAVAVTFGMTAEFLAENIARDEARLTRELEDLARVLAAVVIVEPPGGERLVWVGDRVRRKVASNVAVGYVRAQSGALLRQPVRELLIDAAAGRFRVATAIIMPTCRSCQPAVKRLIDEERLSVDTIETESPGDCVCEGSGAQNLSIRMRFALRLISVDSLLIVGFQPNFPTALDGIRFAEVRHIRNAGDAKAAAECADIAVVVSGSKMGHSESAPYVGALHAAGVRILGTSGNQLSDVIRVLIDEARSRYPELAL